MPFPAVSDSVFQPFHKNNVSDFLMPLNIFLISKYIKFIPAYPFFSYGTDADKKGTNFPGVQKSDENPIKIPLKKFLDFDAKTKKNRVFFEKLTPKPYFFRIFVAEICKEDYFTYFQ